MASTIISALMLTAVAAVEVEAAESCCPKFDCFRKPVCGGCWNQDAKLNCGCIGPAVADDYCCKQGLRCVDDFKCACSGPVWDSSCVQSSPARCDGIERTVCSYPAVGCNSANIGGRSGFAVDNIFNRCKYSAGNRCSTPTGCRDTTCNACRGSYDTCDTYRRGGSLQNNCCCNQCNSCYVPKKQLCCEAPKVCCEYKKPQCGCLW